MSDWVDVAPAADFAPGTCRVALVDGVAVAVFKVAADAYYAIEDCCSHQTAALSEGTLDGLEVACPLHGSRFSLVTGEALTLPAYEPVAVFPVRIEGGMVQVRDDRFD
ncbi:MAG: sufR [Rhodocyclaceae bacterium]|nr:sufR [Rhodocyclaceae bacterium]